MNALVQLRQTLSKQGISFEEFEDGIVVRASAPSGFEIWMEEDDEEATVFFGENGFHEHFDNAAEAVSWFLLGLSNQVRLKVVERGGKPVSCSLEYRDDAGEWLSGSTTGLLFFPYWRKRTVRYLQNGSSP